MLKDLWFAFVLAEQFNDVAWITSTILEYDAADDEAVHDKNLIRDRREEAKKLSGGEY